MQDADTDRVMEGTEVLPDVIGDAVLVEAEEELLAENGGEGEGNVPEKYVCRLAEALMAILDVGEEGVDSIEGLAAAEAGTLGGREQIMV